MRQRDFKKGLGTGEDATRRHAELKKSNTRDQRDEKMQKRRGNGPIPTVSAHFHPESLPALIASLTLETRSLPTLYQILRHPESDYYYERSKLYPEVKGPFLFDNDTPLQWLMSLLTVGTPIEALRMVVACFTNISAHNLQGVYVPRLIRLGLVEKLIAVCRVDDTVYEYTLETLSNMCLDNAESRNYVTSSKIMQIVPRAIDNWQCINVGASFMRSIFRSAANGDLPQAEPLKEMWHIFTHNVLFEHFPDGETVGAGKAANGFSALANILRCIHLLARESDNYKVALANDTLLMNQLAVYCKVGNHTALLIMVELTRDLTIHSLLAQRCIPIFVYCMNTTVPGLIIEGAHGLANLAESVESFPMIACDQVLTSIRMQFEYREVSIAQDLLRQALAWIILTAPDKDTIYPRMIPFICRLSDAIVFPGSTTVIMRSLDALEELIRWNKDLIVPVCEECEVMSRLNKLQHYGTDNMQERVMQLMDWIERGTEWMDE